MEHSFYIEYDDVRLRPIGLDDIELLRVWRNDPEKSRFLTQVNNITPEKQLAWFRDCLIRPDEMLFGIEETKDLRRLVGSMALYNILPDTAEIGKIQIGDSAANGRGIGRKALVLLLWLAFQRLGMQKVFGNVSPLNIPAHKNDMRVGFQIIGRHSMPDGGSEDEIEITRQRLIDVNPYVLDIRIWENDMEAEHA